jgi:NAD-dependent dihydropyrimidine dehydrogenase PreA subunit
MREMIYLPGVSTLTYDASRCNGCQTCTLVCPQGVFTMEGRQARIHNRDRCMECGACARNCEQNALTVQPGVGCAAYVIQTWIKGKDAACCGDIGCC